MTKPLTIKKKAALAVQRAATLWIAACDEEGDPKFPKDVSAGWTRDGALFVFARSETANRLDAVLRDHKIATPQNRHRPRQGDIA